MNYLPLVGIFPMPVHDTRQKQTDSPQTDQDLPFFEAALDEAKHVEMLGHASPGHYCSHYNNIFEEAEKEIDRLQLPIDKDAAHQLLKPFAGMSVETYELYQSLPPENRQRVDEIRERKDAQITKLIEDEVRPALSSQTLLGVFQPVGFHPQEDKRTCEVACFRMIYEAITGEALEETEVMRAARAQGVTVQGQIEGESAEVETMFNILRTEAFQTRFPGVLVRALRFTGMDFDEMREFVTNVQEKIPGSQFFCCVSLDSEVVKDAWHIVLLLRADDEYVYVHDPSQIVGRAERAIPKHQFSERWGKAFLSGIFVISKRTQEAAE